MKMIRKQWKLTRQRKFKIQKKLRTVYHNDLVKRFVYFGRNSSIQGLKYIFQENGTHISRLSWLLLLIVFTGCLYLLLVPVVQRGGSISLTTDTRYLRWNTTFPGVTVCENYDSVEVLKRLLNYKSMMMDWVHFDAYKRHIAHIIYGRGRCDDYFCGSFSALSCNTPWRNLIDNVRKKCDELITNCHFNNVKFPCCKHFYKVDSETGQCFSFNSLQGSYTENLQFYVNRSTGPGVLSFHLLSSAQISVHSSEELSTNVLDPKLRFNVDTYLHKVVDYLFSIVEVVNEPVLENEDINIRQCRFNHEIPDLPLHTYQVYSYGGCRLAQNTVKSFNYCHCIHPIRDIRYKDIYCNYTGIICLIEHKEKSKLNQHGRTDTVECLPACAESELYTIQITKRKLQPKDENVSLINIRMHALPTMRYQKSLLRTKMDFVVTIGGMVGLFFSASILSFAEIFYLILRSPNK